MVLKDLQRAQKVFIQTKKKKQTSFQISPST